MSERPRNVGTDGRKLDFGILKRLIAYIFSKYKIHSILSLIHI